MIPKRILIIQVAYSVSENANDWVETKSSKRNVLVLLI